MLAKLRDIRQRAANAVTFQSCERVHWRLLLRRDDAGALVGNGAEGGGLFLVGYAPHESTGGRREVV